MRNDSELKVITRTKDLLSYLLTITERSPKKYIHTLVARMINTVMDVLELLCVANDLHLIDSAKSRESAQRKAVSELRFLDAIVITSRNVGCILPKQHEVISRYIAEIIKLISAWRKSDLERISKKDTVEK